MQHYRHLILHLFFYFKNEKARIWCKCISLVLQQALTPQTGVSLIWRREFIFYLSPNMRTLASLVLLFSSLVWMRPSGLIFYYLSFPGWGPGTNLTMTQLSPNPLLLSVVDNCSKDCRLTVSPAHERFYMCKTAYIILSGRLFSPTLSSSVLLTSPV